MKNPPGVIFWPVQKNTIFWKVDFFEKFEKCQKIQIFPGNRYFLEVETKFGDTPQRKFAYKRA